MSRAMASESQGPPQRRLPFRLAVACALWLALFALLYTLGASVRLWPELPAGALRGTDLAAGLLFGALVLLALLRRKGP